jgi:TatD DNase family protein
MEKRVIPPKHLIDGHAHLNEINQIDQVLIRARAAGVNRIVAVGMDMSSNRRTIELSDKYPDIIWPAVGYHPWKIVPNQIEMVLSQLSVLLPACVALGEVGLDYKVRIKKPIQWDVFTRVLELADRFRKPVIVHSRYSHQRCHQMVSAAGIDKAVFHWYSGPLDVLDRIVADGYYVSCTPALAYSIHHQKAMSHAPLEHILIETDCPVAFRDQISEPALLTETLAQLSRIKQISIEETALITTANANKFFGG